jgi:NADP-reducing hydrogenase subunit HndB
MGKMTVEDLAKIREAARYKIALRQGAGRVRINVHMGTCGIAAGAREILTRVMKEIEARNLQDVIVTNSGCAGLCSKEPMMTVEVLGEPAPVKYVSLTPAKVKSIIEGHVVGGRPVQEYALAVGSETTR